MPRFCLPRSWFWCCWGCRLFLVPFGSNYAIWGPGLCCCFFLSFIFCLFSWTWDIWDSLKGITCELFPIVSQFFLARDDIFSAASEIFSLNDDEIKAYRENNSSILGRWLVWQGLILWCPPPTATIHLVVRNFKRTRLRHAMPHCGHRLFLEGWQGISAEDFDFLESFWWPREPSFLCSPSRHTLCHVCFPVYIEIFAASVCQGYYTCVRPGQQCRPFVCLQGIAKSQVSRRAWQIQPKNRLEIGDVCGKRQARRETSSWRSQTGSFESFYAPPSISGH